MHHCGENLQVQDSHGVAGTFLVIHRWTLEEFGALQGARRGRVLVRAEGDGASQQDETTRREEARIAALEKLTRSGPEQKKRQQTAVKRQERKAAAPVRAFQGCAYFMRADALGLVEAWHRVVLAQRTATRKT